MYTKILVFLINNSIFVGKNGKAFPYMKKIILFLVGLLFFCLNQYGQNEHFVSCDTCYKNVILEEYTGINCVYCPEGHLIVNQLVEEYPNRIFPINIHVGSFASNTYTTAFGNDLLDQIGHYGFPTGTINRHLFGDSITAVSRDRWESCCDSIMSQVSPVNIAAQGTLDWATRELQITVQLYYTASDTCPAHRLNVAVLQNNIIGPQTGAIANPSQIVGEQYRHGHVLRHLIEDQWGEEIFPTTAGSFIERNYQYILPEELGFPNPIPAKLEDLAFVAFVSQGRQEIFTGCEVELTHLNRPGLHPRIFQLCQTEAEDCSDETSVEVVVDNQGADTLTSLSFVYSLSGQASNTYQWTGLLPPLETVTIHLPNFPIMPNTSETFTAHIDEVNGTAYTGEPFELAVSKSVAAGTRTMTLKIKTDQHASETSYMLMTSDNQVVVQGNDLAANTVNEIPIELSVEDCYRLVVEDAAGNGISSGYVRLMDANNQIVLNAPGASFTARFVGMVSLESDGVEEQTEPLQTKVFPNPVKESLHIFSETDIQKVELFDGRGKRLFSANGAVNEIPMDEYSSGMYFLLVFTRENMAVHKVCKK